MILDAGTFRKFSKGGVVCCTSHAGLSGDKGCATSPAGRRVFPSLSLSVVGREPTGRAGKVPPAQWECAHGTNLLVLVLFPNNMELGLLLSLIAHSTGMLFGYNPVWVHQDTGYRTGFKQSTCPPFQ